MVPPVPHPTQHSLCHTVVLLQEAVPVDACPAGGWGSSVDVLVLQNAQVLLTDLQGFLHQLRVQGRAWPCCGTLGVRDMILMPAFGPEPPCRMGGFGCMGIGWRAENP